MNPTADDYAIAIVAACRETGENPLQIEWRKKLRARHYAIHALIHVFQGVSPLRLCETYCIENHRQFWASSRQMIVEKRNPCGWWDVAAYDRVIRAIEADRTRRAVAPPRKDELRDLPAELSPASQKATAKPAGEPAPAPPSTPHRDAATIRRPRPSPAAPEKLGSLDERGYRPPPGTMKAVLDDDRPIFDRGNFQATPRRDYDVPASKSSLYDELARAAANTPRGGDDD